MRRIRLVSPSVLSRRQLLSFGHTRSYALFSSSKPKDDEVCRWSIFQIRDRLHITVPIVTGDWLAKNINNVKVLDGSWSLKRKKGDPWPVQIPGGYDEVWNSLSNFLIGAVFFDIDDIADQKTWMPHMLPTHEEFEKKVTQLGVQNSDHIVVYDHSNGSFVASARVWWTFRVRIPSNCSLSQRY